MKLGGRSAWEFVTSNGCSLAVGFVTAEGGNVTLKEPRAGHEVKFAYGGLGVGVGAGVKLPKLGRLDLPGVSASSEQMNSYGSVYMMPQFHQSELTASDIAGACAFCEIAGGVGWGHSGYVLTFGMDAATLAVALVHPG